MNQSERDRDDALARQNFGDFTVLTQLTNKALDRAVFASVFTVTLTGLGIWKTGLGIFTYIMLLVCVAFLSDLIANLYVRHKLKQRYAKMIGKERLAAWIKERAKWNRVDDMSWW